MCRWTRREIDRWASLALVMIVFRLLVISLSMFSRIHSARTAVGNWDACGGRLERALDALHRDSSKRNRLEEEEGGISYQQELRSAPLEMSVSRIAVKLPQGARDTINPWARVERCVYEATANSLQTRVMFTDLSVSGMVSLTPRDRKPPIPAESCRMILRLRRAGIEFLTSPIARGRGQMRIRTESSFLEPRFASIYAYGCHPARLDKQIKRQDKWPPFYPPRDEYPTQPLTPNDNYDAAEPRQLVGVSKEVDVVIPNESRQPRFLHAPVAKLGIWRKNVWITKLPLRERRSLLQGKRVSGNSSINVKNSRHSSTLPGSFESNHQTSWNSPARERRSTETITPQDFTSALTRKRSINVSVDPLNRTDTLESPTILANASDNLLPRFNGSERKLNFKREDNFGRNGELFLDENLDNVFPTDFEQDGRGWQTKEQIAREMEDVFLRGASQALTRYIERQLHPAIKETLMLSMGYTISYG